jgi:hypothetical protein
MPLYSLHLVVCYHHFTMRYDIPSDTPIHCLINMCNPNQHLVYRYFQADFGGCTWYIMMHWRTVRQQGYSDS